MKTLLLMVLLLVGCTNAKQEMRDSTSKKTLNLIRNYIICFQSTNDDCLCCTVDGSHGECRTDGYTEITKCRIAKKFGLNVKKL